MGKHCPKGKSAKTVPFLAGVCDLGHTEGKTGTISHGLILQGGHNIILKEKRHHRECATIKINVRDQSIQTQTKTEAVDVVQDLETYPWPFEDNSVDEICSHYVEHVRDLIPFIDEMHRIMKQGAKATIVAPYYASMRAVQDPTHVRFICEASFLYFNKGWRDVNKLDHYQIKSDFDFTYGYSVQPELTNRAEEAMVFAMKYYWNVISDIHAILTKR